LTLIEIGLKKDGSLNLAIENHRLEKEIEKLKEQQKKEINKLQIELDNAADDLATLTKRLETKTIIGAAEIAGMKLTTVVLEGNEVAFFTETPQEEVSELIHLALEKAYKSKKEITTNYLLGSILNFLNSKGYKSKKLK